MDREAIKQQIRYSTQKHAGAAGNAVVMERTKNRRLHYSAELAPGRTPDTRTSGTTAHGQRRLSYRSDNVMGQTPNRYQAKQYGLDDCDVHSAHLNESENIYALQDILL